MMLNIISNTKIVDIAVKPNTFVFGDSSKMSPNKLFMALYKNEYIGQSKRY